MAKISSIEKNKHRKKLALSYAEKRKKLKKIIYDKSTTSEERFTLQKKLAELPRNGTFVRVRNRCAVTGRPRGVYRKFRLSRIALRDLASIGQIPGMTKASW